MEGSKRKRRASPSRIHKIALKNQKTQQLGTESFDRLSDEITATHKDLISKELKSHSVLNHLSPQEVSVISNKFFVCSGINGSYLFKQNDPFAEHFFIVLEGELAVEINGVRVKIYEGEGSFGDKALMYNAPRSASVKFLTNAKMLAVSSQSFKRVLKKIKIKQYQENKGFLENAKFFENLSKEDLDKLAAEGMSLFYKPGTDIFRIDYT